MIYYELTRWWAYRRIKHPLMKVYVWTIPLVMTAFVVAIYIISPVKPPLLGSEGILKSVSQILALLPGFFITALAAVATFQRADMDEEMPIPAPIVSIEYLGNDIDIKLTRRLFLSYLFSYLSIISFLLFFVIAISPYFSPLLKYIEYKERIIISTSYGAYVVKIFFIGVISYFLSSIFISMLHGVYFLCEKMHMPEN